ncbi:MULTISPECIES: glycosyltransferase [Sphingobacterium]|uniref:Glycosyltransferase n=1 Tax=Sphingobacterium litopenaei TaxID=2763500 RepID=A0ABR7YEQ5_9SPHI|nr:MULTISPECIES: glycosyltransferase [Sphingobacterium]MBD1429807.1 glycosyltransferase [Sphingobacterium litopenaei]NGM74743.1 glycosyltransferase [Sphingobacterium sp. SGL-16]
MRDLAPIIIFTYNRPQHTRQMLQALENAELAQDSEVFIFSDGAKNAQAIEQVNKVRAIIAEPWNFKKITICERERNIGLAQNVITGVTEVINQYGKVIVLEDDLKIAKVGLRYFNDALDAYEEEEKVMEISGYMYPVKDSNKLPESFFFRVANSWGWATWARAWNKYNTDIDTLIADFDNEKIKRFSIDHTENFWKQVQEYKAGKINSWAIRWYLTLFNHNGLALYPRQSMIQNMGTDGSGTHSDADTAYHVELATQPVSYFPKEIEENKEAYEAIKYFYKHRKGSLWARAIRFAKKQWNKK